MNRITLHGSEEIALYHGSSFKFPLYLKPPPAFLAALPKKQEEAEAVE